MAAGTKSFGNTSRTALFKLVGANMQLTSDQAFSKNGSFTNYVITKVVAVQRTGGASVACLGGIYSAAAKGGNALVAAGQTWLNLTAAGKTVDATLAAVVGTDIQSTTPFLSLTTGSTAPVTCDISLFGEVLD